MNRIINMYYKEFESYGNFWSLKNPKLFFSIASLFLFIYFVFNLFDSDKRNYLFQDSGLYFVLMAEVFALLLFRSLEKQRDDYIIEKYGKKYNKALGLSEIKKKWLENTIDIPVHEFATLAEKTDKYYILEEKYAKPSLNRDKFIGYIFSSESKNRILAMFMGVVALFMGLNVASGVNIDNLYMIYDSLDFWVVFFWILFISLIIFLFAYMFKMALLMLFNFLDFLFDNTANADRISKRKKEIFISALMQLHELPKKRHRVYF
ncbi:hypothetical protein ACINWC323_0902 [Acinetobacter sp. WC-323]|nr:hypothetical protein ACINWC323_0902 [Acinetobacter sp. WC-323]